MAQLWDRIVCSGGCGRLRISRSISFNRSASVTAAGAAVWSRSKESSRSGPRLKPKDCRPDSSYFNNEDSIVPIVSSMPPSCRTKCVRRASKGCLSTRPELPKIWASAISFCFRNRSSFCLDKVSYRLDLSSAGGWVLILGRDLLSSS